MRFRQRTAGAALIAALLMAAAAEAQTVRDTVSGALETAKRTNPTLDAKLDPATGLPSRIKGLRAVPDPTVALTATARDAQGQPRLEDVRRVVEAFMATSEVAAAFPQGARATREVVEMRRDPDVPGQTIARVSQKVNGVPVFGSSARYVVNPSLAVTEIVASFSTAEIASTTPRIDQAAAITAARARLRVLLQSRPRDPLLEQIFSQIDGLPAEAQLTVFDPALMSVRGVAPGPLKLTWLVSLDSFRFFVDAETSAVVYDYRDHQTVGPRRVFDLGGEMTFPGKQVLDESSVASVTGPGEKPSDAALAFFNSAGVRTYYLDMFGRKSYDDNGRQATPSSSPFESYVRYGTRQNAYWCKKQGVECPKPNVMVYGPSYAVALDVVGHEVTHGVIIHEADLVYSDESGAVNESLADIFGTLIEFTVTPQQANWVIGESLPGRSLTRPLRSLADPPLSSDTKARLFDRSRDYSLTDNYGQPDHYSEYLRLDDPLCNSTWDYLNGCVHFNSGILNKMAFLIAEGGRHHDVTVQGIGRQKLGRLAYRALTTRLNPTSKLAQAGEAFFAACEDLASAKGSGFSMADCAQVDAARVAVGLKTPSS